LSGERRLLSACAARCCGTSDVWAAAGRTAPGRRCRGNPERAAAGLKLRSKHVRRRRLSKRISQLQTRRRAGVQRAARRPWQGARQWELSAIGLPSRLAAALHLAAPRSQDEAEPTTVRWCRLGRCHRASAPLAVLFCRLMCRPSWGFPWHRQGTLRCTPRMPARVRRDAKPRPCSDADADAEAAGAWLRHLCGISCSVGPITLLCPLPASTSSRVGIGIGVREGERESESVHGNGKRRTRHA